MAVCIFTATLCVMNSADKNRCIHQYIEMQVYAKMADTKLTNTDKEGSVLLNIEKISDSVKQDDIKVFADAIDKEIGERKLNKEEIEQLQSIMRVDALEAAKWKNVADVLKYISIFAVAENNPDAVRRATEVLLSIIGIFFPIVNTANGILTRVPDKLFNALIKFGGFATPEYLLYRGIKAIANKKSEQVKDRDAEESLVSEDLDTLIIICKDKMLSTQMFDLINSQDDLDEDNIVGTKDGSVHAIIWNESAWLAFKDKLTQEDRVLIIGEVKNALPLTPGQVRFEKYGIKYGWNRQIATIEADPKALRKKKDYEEFLSAMDTIQFTEKQKKNVKMKFGWGTAAKLALFPPLLLTDFLRENPKIRKQQLLVGIYTLYMRDLAEFLNRDETH